MEEKNQLIQNSKMKKSLLMNALFAFIIFSFSSCEIVGGIFKTGMGVGIFLVVIVIAIVIYIFSKVGKNK